MNNLEAILSGAGVEEGGLSAFDGLNDPLEINEAIIGLNSHG